MQRHPLLLAAGPVSSDIAGRLQTSRHVARALSLHLSRLPTRILTATSSAAHLNVMVSDSVVHAVAGAGGGMLAMYASRLTDLVLAVGRDADECDARIALPALLGP